MASDQRAIRRTNEFAAVTKLCNESGGRISLLTTDGAPPNSYTLEFRCRSWESSSTAGPVVRQTHRVRITLPALYPDWNVKPEAFMLDRVWNMHVWDSNKVCLGQWYPCTLDELVVNIGKLLVLDPTVLNFNSQANHGAGAWALEHQSELPLEQIDWRPSSILRPTVVWEDDIN